MLLQWAWECSDQGGQDRPIRPGQPQSADLTSQYGNLVAQHQQFGGHRGLAARELWQPAEHPNRAEGTAAEQSMHPILR